MQHATIVGTDPRLVGTVTGRMTTARHHLTVATEHATRLLLQHTGRML